MPTSLGGHRVVLQRPNLNLRLHLGEGPRQKATKSPHCAPHNLFKKRLARKTHFCVSTLAAVRYKRREYFASHPVISSLEKEGKTIGRD